jgi:hypothetical protein
MIVKRINDDFTGISVVVTEDKVKIEMPIKNLVNGFELSPNNCEEAKIKRGMSKQFAEWIADNLLDSVDSEKGDNHIVEMMDRLFEIAIENSEEFIKFVDGEDE